MKSFILRVEPRENIDGRLSEFRAYVAEIENGKEVTSNIYLSSYASDPLLAVSGLALKQAKVLDGYKKSIRSASGSRPKKETA